MWRLIAIRTVSVVTAVIALSGCAGGSPGPKLAASPGLAGQAEVPSTSPDASAVACSKFENAIAGPLGRALNGGQGAFGLHGSLDRYGGDLGNWARAIPLNTSNVELINNLEDTDVALVIAATVPVHSLRAQNLKRASSDVDKVTSDCNTVQ